MLSSKAGQDLTKELGEMSPSAGTALPLGWQTASGGAGQPELAVPLHHERGGRNNVVLEDSGSAANPVCFGPGHVDGLQEGTLPGTTPRCCSEPKYGSDRNFAALPLISEPKFGTETGSKRSELRNLCSHLPFPAHTQSLTSLSQDRQCW